MSKVIDLFSTETENDKIAKIFKAIDSGEISKVVLVFERDDDIEVAPISDDVDEYIAIAVLDIAKSAIKDWRAGIE